MLVDVFELANTEREALQKNSAKKRALHRAGRGVAINMPTFAKKGVALVGGRRY